MAAPPTRADDETATPTDVVARDEVPTAPAPPAVRGLRGWWRRLDPKLLLASLAIAVGLVLIGYALTKSVTGDDAARLPDAVEEVTPAFDAIQVPQQTTVIADLAGGYEGYFVIDGIELPTIRQDEMGSIDVKAGEQIVYPPGARFEPGNATLSFTPGTDQAIESFDQGVHTVKIVYWRSIEGVASARSFTWAFTVV